MPWASDEARIRRLHQRGVAATAGGRPADGGRALRTGLRLLGWDESTPGVADPRSAALAARLLISLAYAEAEQGRTAYGFELLEVADTLVTDGERGILVQQRGLMLQRVGRLREALDQLDAAVPLLERGEQRLVLARTLLNRANLHFSAGQIAAGSADLDRCAAIAADIDAPLLHAKAIHLRGSGELLRGDVPRALSFFADAQEQYAQHGPDYVPMVVAARARALLAVGLAGDAGRELEVAIAAFARQRLSQERAEAELMRAHAALAIGDLAGAMRWATGARTHFRGRGNHTWEALADLMRLRAETRRGTGFARRTAALAARLRDLGLHDDAEMADLLSARALIATDKLDEARARIDGASHGRSFGWLETLLTRRITRSELASATGDRSRALCEIRAGLGELHVYRARLGSLDLRVGAAALGRELAATGLRMALGGGSARTVLAWSERARAQAFRVLPVRAEHRPAAADDLAELRNLRQMMRSAELDGRREPGAAARCAELERKLREDEWGMPGTARDTPTIDELTGALAGTVLISFLDHDDRMSALIATENAIVLRALGPAAEIIEAVRRLQADLDALAGRRLPDRIAASVRGSLRHQINTLGVRLLGALGIGDLPVVIVPTPALTAVPWSMLPELAGRPVTVAPSVTTWLSARARAAASPRATAPPLLVAGPDLYYADAELDAITACYPNGQVLRGAAASVETTLRALSTSPVAHLAGHGHHETENVLFSRLDLANGPLMAYDIAHLTAVPPLITLSACDVGRAVVRPGDELLGFTAALLYAGGASIVASVARVTHESAASIMIGFHRASVSGRPPAEALAMACAGEPMTPFVCFGAG